jgi:hyperosmotically inducible protein
MRSAEQKVENATKTTRDAAQDKLRALHLSSVDIKDELARTGQVVRRKASEAGHAIADATADTRITAAIKGKLLASRDLSALNISVNTSAGVVTLSGFVSSSEHISKAILLAMETDGVREVVSTLQVKPKAK